VKRGGSWNNNANNCTVSNRNNNATNTNNNTGFRCISIFMIRICPARMADQRTGNPDFYPAPGNGTKSKEAYGLVALSNGREADIFVAAGVVLFQVWTIQLTDDR
jgi:hypothetical protein